MAKSIISEGKTSTEAIENGLKQLKVSKDKVEIKILESEEKRSFFSILDGKDAGKLIGYRGETLNSMQTILSAIANKQVTTRAHVILDIEGYRAKRQKALEELADKLTRTVINTGKQVTLEPMPAYERKIIHNRLQDSKRVKTYSIGEEPYRKVVITKK
mgnify:CR=1 FL=1